MITTRQVSPRYLGLLVMLAMAGFAAVGFYTIRKDLENLRVISQDNTQWSASQMEIELLRFRLSLAELRTSRSPEADEEMQERFDILWSRVFMMGHGHVGESLLRYDGENGPVTRLAAYLRQIDPAEGGFDSASVPAISAVEATLEGFQDELRQYTLRVMRADSAASALVRDRINGSTRTIGVVSVAAVLLGVLSLLLILRESRRQQHLAEISLRSAEQAEFASRAKSRLLTMMSHELRNPMNGILGPLALLGQSDLSERLQRLVTQAQQSGQSMLQMLSGLLDYGEMQDGRFHLQAEPFRVAALIDTLRDALRAEGAGAASVRVEPGTPERVNGDLDRLRQIFMHLALYMIEGRDPATAAVRFEHDGVNLIGDVALAAPGEAAEWKLDLLMGLSDISPDQVTAEALRPLIARGLILACHGIITLVDDERDGRIIRVSIPAEPVRFEQIRVHLETRSAALAALYRAALRSDRVAFVARRRPRPGRRRARRQHERRRRSAHGAVAPAVSERAVCLAWASADAGSFRRHRGNAERHVAAAHQHHGPARLRVGVRNAFCHFRANPVSYAERGRLGSTSGYGCGRS